MEDRSKAYEDACREYCEPLHRVCLTSDEESDERCEEKLKQCISFCEFA